MTAVAGTSQGQEPGTLSESPMGVVQVQVLGLSAAAFLDAITGSWISSEAASSCTVPMWGAKIAGGGLIC